MYCPCIIAPNFVISWPSLSLKYFLSRLLYRTLVSSFPLAMDIRPMGNTREVYRTRYMFNVSVEKKNNAGSLPEWTRRTSNISIAHKVACMPTISYSKSSCIDSPIANSSQSPDHLIRHKSEPRYDNETFRREA